MPLIKVTPAQDRRVLHYGCRGRDVEAYQRLAARTLRALGLVSVNQQNGTYGQGTIKDTLALQHHAGLKADGKVGPKTWSAVDPQMKAYERLLLKRKPPPPPPVGDKIAHELEVMFALRLDRYTQARPAARAAPYPWKRGADCSGSYLLARARALGIPYDGWGNTGTIWDNYAHVAPGDVRRGDAALYGHNGTTTHVQGVTEIDVPGDPMTVGFGNAPGTRARVSYRRSEFMGYRRGA